MSRLETNFLERLGDGWQSSTPGFKVQAFSKRKKVVDIEVGETFKYYDLASLTKLMFTTTRLMMLVDDKKLSLNMRVSDWIKWFPSPRESSAPSAQARLRNLLSHAAGLNWWYPFFQKLAPLSHPDASHTEKFTSSPEVAWQFFEKILSKQILIDIRKQSEKENASESVSLSKIKSVYSDLDFFLLGFVMCEATSESLYDGFQQVRARLDLRETDFHRGNQPLHARRLYAPTEDCKWRGKVLHGEVHDENTWALCGVAPHAGLFGPIDDLSHWGLALRDAYYGKGPLKKTFASQETVHRFAKRALTRSRGDWGLGFMLPTRGRASCGKHFSSRSIGHTGFTGTSLWFDPVQDLLITVVANRVYPTREDRGFASLRPRIHDLIAEQL